MSRSAQASLLFLLILAAGCVSSPETKQASTQYKVALNTYSQDVRAFGDAWTGEIDMLLIDLGDALVARAVTEKVRVLSDRHDGFSSASWEREVAGGGLIAMSEAIDNERDRVRNVIKALNGIALPTSEDPAEIVDHVLDSFEQVSIIAIESNAELAPEERQRLIAEANLGPFGEDAVANSIVRLMIIWRAAKEAIPGDLRNLQTVLSALKTAHASVDRWIQTDVTVPGEDIAELVQRWSVATGGAQ